MYGHGLAFSALLLFCCFTELRTAATELCSGTRTIKGKRGMTGRIDTPKTPGRSTYPRNISCSWIFESTDNSVVSVRWISFELESQTAYSGGCNRDYIIVVVKDYLGEKHVSKRYCGTKNPQDVETLQKWIMVKFHSDLDETQATGASFDYEFMEESKVGIRPSMLPNFNQTDPKFCGEVLLTAAKKFGGELRSPGYPKTYLDKLDCAWLIRVPSMSAVYVQVVALNLGENLGDCEKAELTIMDGYAHYHEGLATELATKKDKQQHISLCGQMSYHSQSGDKSFLSNRNRVIIRFRTKHLPSSALIRNYEEKGEAVGFHITWTLVYSSGVNQQNETCKGFRCKGDDQCIDKDNRICAEPTRICIPNEVVCDGVKNCGEKDVSDEENCNTFQVVVISLTIVGLLFILMVLVCCHRYFRNRHARKEFVRRTNRQKDENRNLEDSGCEPRTNHVSNRRRAVGREKCMKSDSFEMDTSLPHIHARRDEDSVKEPFLAENHVPPKEPRQNPRPSTSHVLPVYAQVNTTPQNTRRQAPQSNRAPSKPYPPEIRHLANQRSLPSISVDRRNPPPAPERSSTLTKITAGPPPPVRNPPSFVTDISDRHNLITRSGQRRKPPPEYPGPPSDSQEMSTFNPRPILKKAVNVQASSSFEGDSETTPIHISRAPPPPVPPKPPTARELADYPSTSMPSRAPHVVQALPKDSRTGAQVVQARNVQFTRDRSSTDRQSGDRRQPVEGAPIHFSHV